MSGAFQLVDPVTGAPKPAKGVDGRLMTSLPANAIAIVPDDNKLYDPPITVWVGDAGAVNVAVVPYGMKGDPQVIYPANYGLIIPVLAKKVLATGTTALLLRGQF